MAEALPGGGSILELGCGAGRITRQLVERGYVVTAVDESPEMLAHVAGAQTVPARIEGLDLVRRFDAVLLASNLINAPHEQRRAFLDTCRRHSDLIVVEGLPLGWQPEDGESQLGEVATRLRIVGIEAGCVRGEVEYSAAGRSWRHVFAMQVFADRDALDAALAEAGFRFDRWLGEEGGGWFLAVVQ